MIQATDKEFIVGQTEESFWIIIKAIHSDYITARKHINILFCFLVFIVKFNKIKFDW